MKQTIFWNEISYLLRAISSISKFISYVVRILIQDLLLIKNFGIKISKSCYSSDDILMNKNHLWFCSNISFHFFYFLYSIFSFRVELWVVRNLVLIHQVHREKVVTKDCMFLFSQITNKGLKQWRRSSCSNLKQITTWKLLYKAIIKSKLNLLLSCY